jgi:phage-related protein
MAETPTMEVRARLTAETAQFTKGMQQATQSVDQFSQKSSNLRGAVLGIGIAAGTATAAMIAFGTKAFMAAARVDELDVSMNAVGKATGLGYQAIRDAAIATKDMGIEMEIAQQSAIKFAQNNLKLSYASELARAAQDLAVVSGKNSTETFNMLTHAVITGRSEVLKSVGIQKSAGQMYESFAKSIGKSANQLTYQEKQTAVATGALKEAAKVAGVYEAAMDSPGKVLRSFARITNEIQVALGSVLLKGLGPMIKAMYDVYKNISKALTSSEGFKNIMSALGMVIVKLTAPVTAFLTYISDLIKKFTEAKPPVETLDGALKSSQTTITSMAEKFEMLLPVLASVGSAFAVMAGKQLFSAIPVLGQVLARLSPLPVALIVLAATSTQVRTAMINLLNAFKPILPIFVAIGKAMGALSVVAVAVLAKAINFLATIVRGSINFIKTYAGVFKTVAIIFGVLAIGVGAYMAQVIILNAVTKIQTALTTAQATVTGFLAIQQAKLNMIMAMNPIGVYIGVIVALLAALGYLMATNENVAKVVGKVFNFIIKIVVYVLAYIVKAVGHMLKAYAMWIRVLGFVAEVVAKVFEFIIDVILTYYQFQLKVIKFIVDAFISLMETNSTFASVIENVFNFVIKSILKAVRFVLTLFKNWIDFYINVFDSQNLLYKVVQSVFNAIAKVIGFVISTIINIFGELVGGIGTVVNIFNKLFSVVKSVFLAIVGAMEQAGVGIFGILNKIAEGVGKFLGWVFDKMTGWLRGLASLFSKIPKIGDDVAKAINSGLDATEKVVTGFASGMVGLGEKMFDGILDGAKKLVNGVTTIGSSTKDTIDGVRDTLKKFSANVTEFSDKDFAGNAIDALIAGGQKVSDTLGGIIEKIKDAEEINFGKTIINGLITGAKLASNTLGTMIDVIQDVKDFDFARTVGNFIDGIATKADQAGEFLIGLSASMMEFADNTDFAGAVADGIGNFIEKIKNSLKEGLGFGDILAEEKKKYNEASDIIDDGSAAEDALKAADRMKAIREAMQAGIDSIKGVLDDLRQASGEFADSLKDTILGFAGLKSIELPDGFVPKAKSLIENMRQRLDKSNQFAQQIATLQAMGLDSGALKDIIESGPVKGAQLAASILGGGAEAIQQINSLQKAISFSGAAIGQYGADAAFGGLIGNAQAQLNRLTEAELATRTSGTNQFIQQGAFQVVVNTRGAANTEEEIKMITDKIEQTFVILAKELAAK